jgi:hypothetical protein
MVDKSNMVVERWWNDSDGKIAVLETAAAELNGCT